MQVFQPGQIVDVELVNLNDRIYDREPGAFLCLADGVGFEPTRS